jgi:thiol:disulfide interchange protein DsbA
MSSRIVPLLVALAAGPCFGQEAALRAGVDYEPIRAPQQSSSPSGVVEVAEVFQYGCGGCALFEPYLESWTASKPEHIELVRIPAIWSSLGELHARAFYTAEALGILDEIHAPFFRALHVEGNRLDTHAKLREFFAAHGVDAKTFDARFDSFAVYTKVRRAKELVARYGIPETPSIVVNGKYLTRGGLAGSYERWLEIVEALAERERHGRPGAALVVVPQDRVGR